MSLSKLPYEIISLIVQELDLDDVFHLGLLRRFHYLIQEDRSHAPATPEAQEAKSTHKYASALRRLYKRRHAIRTAAPFTAAIVAVAESWIYVNGTLCHMSERTLRVLDLHRSSGEETIIDVRALLDEAVAASRGARKYKFQILHYAEGIVSCLYTHCRPVVESWLVVFNVKERTLLTTLSLDTTYKIFVRNDRNYLYFGTHSEFGDDGFRRWVLMGYDIQRDRWFDQKVHLLDMVGSDIGQSIAFEVIDGKFYGLSNQTSFEVDEVDWTSHYHCFRFPVKAPKPKTTERSVKDKMWRRQHAEGPIDDRWSFIRILRDERDPRQLQVLESRKEWLAGNPGRRNYYTTRLVFPDTANDSDDDEDGNSSSSSSSTDDDEEPHPHNVGGGIIINPATESAQGSSGPHITFNSPHLNPPRPRCPFNTHAGDDASTALMFTLSKCFIRSYHPSSQTFLDLVDDPLPPSGGASGDGDNIDDNVSDGNENGGGGRQHPRLRLRAGSRRLRPASAILADPVARDESQPHGRRAARLYEDDAANTITFWPPAQLSSSSPGDAHAQALLLDELHRVVNPPAHEGAVRGAWDERSLVYSTGGGGPGGGGGSGAMQALVFVSFDPGVRLPGLKAWGDECARRDSGYGSGVGEEMGEEMGGSHEGPGHWATGHAGEEASCEVGADKGKGKQVPASPQPLDEDVDDAVSSTSSPIQSVGYCPGWTPEASAFDDWGAELTSTADDRCKGKGKGEVAIGAPGSASASAASCDVDGDGGDAVGPLGVGAGQSFSSSTAGQSSFFSSFDSAPDDGVPGASGASGTSSSQYRQPCEAATAPKNHVPSCKWAHTETAMWRGIGFGFNDMPDFTSPRLRRGGESSAV
ncbi:hypothetical protein Daus18300_011939 [Diaporthe australafricana]|uniref:F-box domain-containing protein n=1 Tax=Diaporthe australafricana TaxID=127596 RepID=A0ABR3W4Q5_9PEZI